MTRADPSRTELERRLSERTGIDLSRGGVRRSLTRFLEQRLGELALHRLSDYVDRVAADTDEFERLVNAITVVYTWFFRDEGQLAAIEQLLRERAVDGVPMSIWVPGCATGEDAYSLALLAARVGRPVFVLGTDVNSEALAHARTGIYGGFSVKDLDPFARGYFSQRGTRLEVGQTLRSCVRFERQNLVDAPPIAPHEKLWDLILCRNVLIYFARDSARQVLERMARALAPGGHLVLGASEVVFEVPTGLESVYHRERLLLRRGDSQQVRAPTPAVSAPRPERPQPVRVLAGPVPALPPRATQIANSSLRPTPPTADETRRLLRHGHALLDRGDTHAARESYLQAVRLDGTSAEARLYAGIAHYLCGDLESALEQLRAAGFLDSRCWMACLYSALCHESLGHTEEALREYRNVVRLGDVTPRAGAPTVFGAWQSDLLSLARQRVAGGMHARRG